MASLSMMRDLLPASVPSRLWSWADQAVVSAASFLALILVARWTDASNVGLFAIGNSILAVLLVTQESLVTRPYTIRICEPMGTPGEHAHFALISSLALSTLGAVVVAVILVLISSASEHDQLAPMFVLAGAVPFVLMRDFARRHAFANLKIYQALILDSAVALLTLIGLGLMGWAGALSAATALAVVGGACAIGALTWLYGMRHAFTPARDPHRKKLRTTWKLGKWFLASQLAIQIQGYMVQWLSLILAGAAATGVFAACASIVAIANPVLFGFFNQLLPQFVRILRQHGGRGLIAQALRDALTLFVLMAVFCSGIAVFGDDLMSWLYPGEEYANSTGFLTVLALSSLVAAVGAPASLALASAERARVVAGITAFTAVLNLLLACVLITRYGLLGAAYSTLVAEFIGSAGRWISLVMLAPQLGQPDPMHHGHIQIANPLSDEAAS